MKAKKLVFIILWVPTLLLTGCIEPTNTTFSLTYNSQVIEACDDAKFSLLGGGGYRIHCQEETRDIYMIYDTETGTIKMFWIPAQLWAVVDEFIDTTKTLHVFGPDTPSSNCPAPNMQPGKSAFDPIPLTLFSNFQPGTYTLDLAKPCGTVSVHFGKNEN